MLRSETAASPQRRTAALAGLARYQQAPRPAPPVLAAPLHRAGRAALRAHGGTGPTVVLVPSLINPPAILDLSPENSLIGWIAAQGFRALSIDWGVPTPNERALDVAGHIETMLLPLLDALDEPPLLVGYCLGGTMAIAAAARRPLAGLATIAAPWRFAGYGADPGIDALWDSARDACDTLGLVPMEVLQAGFWQLDPARTIAKYEAFATLPPDSPAAQAFVTLEDWANAGAPLTFAAGRELFEDMHRADRPGRGAWQVAGDAVTLDQIACPGIEFVARADRIVPAAAAAGLSERRDVAAGHVGMIVGSRAHTELWRPLRDWLRGVAAPR